MQRRIAVVEDDQVILQNYADFLTSSGFSVDTFSSKEAALRGVLENSPRLVLLDITLHGEQDAGYEICGELRRRAPKLPIVFLTSHDSEVDKISGLRVGADDYITKDVSLDYLIVRIEALLRRQAAYAGQSTSVSSARAALELNDQLSIASWRGKRVDLSLTQYWMVEELHRRAGQAVSHRELMRAAKVVIEPNTVTAHVKAIRAAFERIDADFNHIVTERGRGYRWLDEAHSESAEPASAE